MINKVKIERYDLSQTKYPLLHVATILAECGAPISFTSPVDRDLYSWEIEYRDIVERYEEPASGDFFFKWTSKDETKG
jgi:hypothetical protein